MKSVAELKEERQNKNSELFNKVGLFWAFSNEQFNTSKTPLKEGEKYVSIGAGGYLPKGNVDELLKGLEEIKKWYNGEIKKNKAEEAEIIYELHNHECFYTNDITDVVEMFKDTYSEDLIIKIYCKERKKVNA
jgi:hypothetical protein